MLLSIETGSSVNGSSVVTKGMLVVEKIDFVVTTEMCVVTTNGSVITTGLLLSQQSFFSYDRNSC